MSPHSARVSSIPIPGGRLGVRVLVAFALATALLFARAGLATAAPLTTESLKAVHLLGTGVGYAVSAGGSILKTTNGGADWSVIWSAGCELSGIAASGQRAWAVGRAGQLFRTVNAGGTWETRFENLGDPFYIASPLNAVDGTVDSRVFVAGGAPEAPPMVYTSTDSGQSFPYQNVLVAGDHEPPSYMPEWPKLGLGQFYEIDLVYGDLGWVVGHDAFFTGTYQHNDGVIWKYDTNVQESMWGPWFKQATFSGSGPLYGVSFGSTDWGIAVGAGGRAYYTLNGGRNWTLGTTGTTRNLRAVAVAGMSTAWAVGDSGTILYTTDGGAHWTSLNSSTSSALYGIASPGGLTAVAVGNGGTIVRTTDGVSWASAFSDRVAPVTSVLNPESRYLGTASITLSAADNEDTAPATWWKLDDGEWTAGTSVTTSVAGPHTLYYYSEDDAGNREPEKSFGFEVLATTRYEQNNTLITYRGTWTTLVSSSAFSGGSLARANSSGTGLSVRFTGTGLDLIGYKGPLYGMARVTIDGGEPEYIDLYNPSNTGQQLVWRKTGLADGPHDVSLEWANLKNPASGGYMVCLDAVDIAGTLLQAPIRCEQDNSLITYRGTWTTLTSSSAFSGGSLARANNSGSALSIRLTGTGLDLIGYTGPLYGKARVAIDGGEPEYIDFYNPSNTGQQLVWRKTGLTDGTHDVSVEWANLKNPASGGYMVCLDAVDVAGTLLPAQQAPTRYEQDNPLITYRGAWTTLTNSSAFSGGSLARANSSGAGLSVRFNGTSIDLIGYTGPLYGKARVIIDGGEPEYIDFYNPVNTGKQLVWRKTGLADEIHDVSLEWASLKNPASGGYMVCLDAVEVLGTLQSPTRYEQDNPLISYRGTWTTLMNSSAFSGGTLARANSSGAGLSVRFNGTSIDLISYTGLLYGMARVTIDGGEPEYIDFYNPVNIGKQLVWRKTGLADGIHDVTLEWANLRNPASGGYMINLDAFDIAGEIAETPAS